MSSGPESPGLFILIEADCLTFYLIDPGCRGADTEKRFELIQCPGRTHSQHLHPAVRKIDCMTLEVKTAGNLSGTGAKKNALDLASNQEAGRGR